jgi:26S proteasome regulatory subunit N11
MLDMLAQTGRPERVVGWYHSHPGFGCWLSGIDMATQQMFEKQNARAVAVVIDPVQSVKGKVVIDVFRMIPGIGMMMMPPPGFEARQTTSNVGYLKKPTIQARIHGLDRYYYSLVIDWRKNDFEEQMLMNLHKKDWSSGLHIQKYHEHQSKAEALMADMNKLSKEYVERVKQEEGLTPEELEVKNVGKVDPKKHLESDVHELMAACIVQALGTMINTVVF